MYTYSDLEKYLGSEDDLKTFIQLAIGEHVSSPQYKIAKKAMAYYRHENPDIASIEKIIYDALGRAHIDAVSPNHKLANAYYPKIINQSVSHLLTNGIAFAEPKIKERLGANFDGIVKKILTDAKNCGVSYGYFNGEKLIHFPYEQFKAIPDDYTGDIRAGIRFFKIDDNKPLMITFYEADGFTEFVKETDGDIELKHEKQKYNVRGMSNDIEGMYDEADDDVTSVLPIYPLYNINKQSDIVGNLNLLVAIDIVNSNLVNNVSQGEIVYWVLKNYGGMDDVDRNNFLVKILKTHVLDIDGDEEATPHQISVPFEASQATEASLKRQLFDNMDGVLTETLNAGNLTATAINSAYSDLRQRSGLLEYEIIEFLHGIFRIAGIPEDTDINFIYYETVNPTEMIQNIIASAQFIGDEEATKLLCNALGVGDDFDIIQEQKAAAAMERASLIQQQMESAQETEVENNAE